MSYSAGLSTCLVCFDTASSSIDNKQLTSSSCGHKVCRSCLQHHVVSSSNSSTLRGGPKDSSPHGVSVTCPLCRTTTALSEWKDRESDETFYEQEKLVRQRVASVYNMTRNHFETTPAYNDYLEQREEIVYTLTFSTDEAERKRYQEELESYELEHQKQIVECQQRALKDEREWICDIVKKEGTFFERAQLDYMAGFRLPSVKLVHALQRRYPDLFLDDDAKAASGLSNEKQAATKLSKDNPTAVTIGAGNQPKPLDPNIVYSKLPRRPCIDKAAMLRACGLSKSTIGRRVADELWGGLRCGIKKRI